MPERTVFQSVSQRHVVSLSPQASVWDAACIMTKANCGSILVIDSAGVLQGILTESGFRHLPIINTAGKIMGVFSVRDALPREIGAAVSLAEFNDQVNDALG